MKHVLHEILFVRVTPRRRCLLAVAFSSVAWQGWSQPSLQQLYDDERWFELRDAVDDEAAPLYLAAVASAFNRPQEAERQLERVIRESSDETARVAARDALFYLFLRAGRYADVLKLANAILAISPDRADAENLRRLLGPANTPNQRVVTSRRASFACTTGSSGVLMPVTVNGRAVQWVLDTGANFSVLSESEARMLGMALAGGTGEIADSAGGAAAARMAVAQSVTIGGTELRDVSMLAFPDARPPWNELEPGHRGIVGLPLALALDNIRWTSSGTCETGPRRDRARASESNLAISGATPVVRIFYAGRPLSFMLDTGNVRETQLWPRFAADFPQVVAQGTRSSVRLTQIGGSEEHDVTVLAEAQLRIGDFDAALRPANVFSEPVGDGRSHGNLGMDLLSQASEVTVDFRSMTVGLR